MAEKKPDKRATSARAPLIGQGSGMSCGCRMAERLAGAPFLLPAPAAPCRGVRPLLSRASTLAPFSISKAAGASNALLLAACSGVSPEGEAKFTDAPRSSRPSMIAHTESMDESPYAPPRLAASSTSTYSPARHMVGCPTTNLLREQERLATERPEDPLTPSRSSRSRSDADSSTVQSRCSAWLSIESKSTCVVPVSVLVGAVSDTSPLVQPEERAFLCAPLDEPPSSASSP